jgi:uncharacterized SAM-binding protein YcdF (DUF218 family)
MDADLLFRALCRAVVLPPVGPMVLVLLGLWILPRRRPLAVGLIATGVVGVLLLSMPVFSDALARSVQDVPSATPEGAVADAGVIVMLGGGIGRSAEISGGYAPLPKALERLAGAARLVRDTGLPLLLSGGAVEAGPAEADVLERVLERSFGLKARYLERRSRTTRENARETAAILRPLGVTHIVLVTSALHMHRARAEFEAVGFVVVPAPVAVVPPSDFTAMTLLPNTRALDRSREAIYEWLGERVAVLSGRR